MLSSNRLSSLPPALLASLPSLNTLSLDHNRLERLPVDLLAGDSNLLDLALNNNLLTEIPPTLANLERLRTLGKISGDFFENIA